MPLKDLKVGLTNLIKRPKEAVVDLVDKFRRQELRVPQIRLENLAGPIGTLATSRGRETLIRGTQQLRGVGQAISGLGQRIEPTPDQLRVQSPFVSLTRQTIARPLQFGGETIRQAGALGERILKPAETLRVFKQAPTTRGISDPFGTFEQPTKLGIATDIFGAGFDASDIVRYGLLGVFGGGVRAVSRQGKQAQQTLSAIDKLDQALEAGRKARQPQKFGISIDKARQDLLDRLTPVFDLVQKAGKELPTTQNPYKRLRLIAGLGGKVEATLKGGLAPVLQKEAHRLNDLSKLLLIERMEEVASHGKKTFLSATERADYLGNLKLKYGEQGFATLQQSAQEVRNYADTLLDSLHKSGIVGDKAYQAIKAKNELYVPFQVVDYISENVEKGNFARTSFNVARQDVIKTMKGSEKAVGDPLEALVERTAKVLSLVERNDALKSLVDLRKTLPDVFGDLITPAKGATPKGFDTINLFENGQNVKYFVPQDVASAIKNLDSQTSNVLTEILRPQANILRLGATSLNLPFIFVNPIRDFADALFGEITEKGVKAATQFIASYPVAIASALRKDDLYQQWALAGGRQATFTSQIVGIPQQTVRGLAGLDSGLKKLNPVELLRFFNSVAEESTRLARFRAGVQRGERVAEAAFRSRDITVDFAKSGNLLKQLNQVIPFLNANVQGVERMFRIAKNNPKGFAVAVGILSGFPATMLYLHNRQFEDYNDIPQWEKDLNWIIIARDRTPVEKLEGEPIRGIKVPKGRIAGVPANITESFLQFIDKNDSAALSTLAQRVLTDVSPIGLPVGREGMLRTLGTVLPPIARGIAEVGTNTSFFTGLPIVPEKLKGVEASEQYREKTPGVYKALGKLGVSPLLAEQFVRTTTGGAGATAADILSGKSPFTGVARRFTDIRSGAEVDRLFDEVEGIARTSKTATLKEQREAERVYAEMSGKSPQEASTILKSAIAKNPTILKRLQEIEESKQLGLTALDRSIKALPVKDGSRARFIISQLEKAKSGEEKQRLIGDYIRKKILTDEVAQQVNVLLLNKQKAQPKPEKQSLKVNLPKLGLVREAKAAGIEDYLPSTTTVIEKGGRVYEKKEPPKKSLGKSIVDFLKRKNPFNPPIVLAPTIENPPAPPAQPEKKPELLVEMPKDKNAVAGLGRNPVFEKVKPRPEVKVAIEKAAAKFRLPASLLYDISFAESSLDPKKEGPTSDIGLFQFTDDTWETIKHYANDPSSSLYGVLPNLDRHDPLTNALAAAYLIRFGQLGRWDASKENWGLFWDDEELNSLGAYAQRL